MEQAYEPAPSPDQKRNWIPLLIGLVAVVVAVGAIFLFLRPKSQGGIEPNGSVTPDNKWVIFSGNMFGMRHVYAVEIAKSK